MKRILIVYFSHTGNNRLFAEHLSKKLGADLCPISEKSKRSTLTLLLDVAFNRLPKIHELEKPLASYEHIIFVAPLWNAKIANPLKSLLLAKKESIPEYSFITVCGGYELGNQMETVTKELTGYLGKGPKAVFEFDISDLFRQKRRNKSARFQATE